MKNKMPNSPFTTAISGSEKETTLRIRNIVQGKKKRPAVPLLVLMGAIILLCGGLMAWRSTGSIERPDERIFCDYYADLHSLYLGRAKVYPSSAAPKTPQPGSIRVDEVTYLDQCNLGDVIGAAYRVECSMYSGDDDGWTKNGLYSFDADVIIATWTPEGELIEVLGLPIYNYDGLTMEQIIQQRVWMLENWDVSVHLEDGSAAIGPGWWWEENPFLDIADDTLHVGRLPGQNDETHYMDQWYLPDRIAISREKDGSHEPPYAFHIDVMSDEFFCPRGVHIGSTEEELLAAYADVIDTDRWESQPEYNRYVYHGANDPTRGICFYCVGGEVTRLMLDAGLEEN